MAKSPTPGPGQATDPAGDPARGIEPSHREFYELGRRVKRALHDGASSKAMAARLEAERSGTGPERCERALDFFEQFGESDLERLGRMKTGQGRPIPVTYLYIVSVDDPAHREALLRFLESGRRSWAELAAENRRLRGEQLGSGGKRHRPPATLADALDQVSTATDEWIKVYGVAWPEELPPSIASEAGRPDHHEPIADLLDRLNELQKSASRLKSRLRWILDSR
jgi:hypothetical protein